MSLYASPDEGGRGAIHRARSTRKGSLGFGHDSRSKREDGAPNQRHNRARIPQKTVRSGGAYAPITQG